MQPICGGRSGLSSWQHLPSEMLHVREVRESVEFLRGIGGRYFQSDHDNRYFLLDKMVLQLYAAYRVNCFQMQEPFPNRREGYVHW